jgi:beta-mannosidase
LELLPCTVPGNFELDLLEQGRIPEPFQGMNIAALTRYERAHVWYACEFEFAGELGQFTPWLVLEGVDTFAEVFLNGVSVGKCANMLIPNRFPLPDLRERNELIVHIRPSVEEARKFDYPAGLANQLNAQPGLYIRKAPHMWGWDIMPRAVSAGLWRGVSVELVPPEPLDWVWLETRTATAREAQLALHWRARLDPESVADYWIELRAEAPGGAFQAEAKVLFEAGRTVFKVPAPRLWWPRDRGEPTLYQVTVRLLKNGVELDRREFRHGIRTVELRRTSVTDEAGGGEFSFIVNGEQVFIRGTNWVPADAYHSRDAERLPRILELAWESGCNLLRCWGGNVYESREFFDFCDERGLLVWQDFALACAVYPQEDAFARVLEEEARVTIRRLRQHASLVLWAGDNECDQAYGWHHRGSPNRNRLTREVLPRVVAEEDPSRPFLPSSPYIDPVAEAAGERYLPENHLWGPRDYYKSPYYAASLCHFASEIGYHGCPAPESIREFISPEKLWPPGNDEWVLHSTSPVPGVDLHDYRTRLMSDQLVEMFGALPDNLDDYAFQSQCVQAEAKKFFIELFRGAKWRRTGIIWWNLMDGWPQFSDAVVDYYFRKKLAFDFIQRAQAPLLVMLREADGWFQDVVVCNDTREDLPLTWELRDADSGELWQGTATAQADAVTLLERIPHRRAGHRFYLIRWETPVYGPQRGHYLAGNPPFSPERYRAWLEMAYSE